MYISVESSVRYYPSVQQSCAFFCVTNCLFNGASCVSLVFRYSPPSPLISNHKPGERGNVVHLPSHEITRRIPDNLLIELWSYSFWSSATTWFFVHRHHPTSSITPPRRPRGTSVRSCRSWCIGCCSSSCITICILVLLQMLAREQRVSDYVGCRASCCFVSDIVVFLAEVNLSIWDFHYFSFWFLNSWEILWVLWVPSSTKQSLDWFEVGLTGFGFESFAFKSSTKGLKLQPSLSCCISQSGYCALMAKTTTVKDCL